MIERIKADWQQRHDAVLEAGGLHIGTERHESRRIDNQLRAERAVKVTPVRRSFPIPRRCLDAHIMSDRIRNMMKALGMQQGESIEHRMVNNAIEKAQRKVEVATLTRVSSSNTTTSPTISAM